VIRAIKTDRKKDRFLLEPGDVEAAVYEGDFAGDAAGEVAREEDGGVAYFELVDVAVEGGALFDGFEDFGEVANAAGGEGLDGAGGDGVDADVFAAERGGEVADGGFECGFGDTHDVVVGEDLGGAVVGEGEDTAAFSHERYGGSADGDKRVDTDVVGDAEVFTGGEEEVVFDGVGGGEGDRVDDDVEGAVDLFQGGEESVDLGVGADVALIGFGVLEFGDEGVGFFLEALVLVADGEGGAGFGELLGYAPGDAALVGEAEDDGDFAFEINHGGADSFQCGLRPKG
jgi:hypothetical protein